MRSDFVGMQFGIQGANCLTDYEEIQNSVEQSKCCDRHAKLWEQIAGHLERSGYQRKLQGGFRSKETQRGGKEVRADIKRFFTFHIFLTSWKLQSRDFWIVLYYSIFTKTENFFLSISKGDIHKALTQVVSTLLCYLSASVGFQM